jgi:hypothetical protein
MGDFEPTELGDRLMPTMTGARGAPIDVQRTNEFAEADAAAAQVHFDSLELELRAPDGSVVATEWIDVRDTALLLSLGDEIDEEIGAIDPVLADDERAFPRYQIQVGLSDEAAVP